MRVITEIELREKYKKMEFTSFVLPKGCRLTPSAAQFLNERKIQIIKEEEVEQKNDEKIKPEKEIAEPKQKEEYMTHLRGSTLVPKNHLVIKFRGKLDTLEALLILAIIEVENIGYFELARDLRDLLDYSRQIMKAEVKEETLPPLKIRGWSHQEIRERSHYVKKYYDINHFTPQPGHGKLIATLNLIRTQCRELELAAIDAFYSELEVKREDIIQALNRFSSFVYVLMAQVLSGKYKYGSE
jgi:ethanolamine utilization cobalamin adenosyltransferase